MNRLDVLKNCYGPPKVRGLWVKTARIYKREDSANILFYEHRYVGKAL
jgi:hypothetical protein